MARNLADEQSVKEQAKKDEKERKLYLLDLKKVLGTAEGRRVWWAQLSCLDRISAHQSGSWTYFNEGERNVSLRMKADAIEADDNAFMTMQQEAINKAKEVEDDD